MAHRADLARKPFHGRVVRRFHRLHLDGRGGRGRATAEETLSVVDGFGGGGAGAGAEHTGVGAAGHRGRRGAGGTTTGVRNETGSFQCDRGDTLAAVRESLADGRHVYPSDDWIIAN